MGKAFKDCLAIVSIYWPLIIAVGVGGTFLANGIWLFLSTLGAIVSVLVGIIVHGRIIAHLVPERTWDSWVILKENWLNYLIVVFVVGTPILALRLFVLNQQTSYVEYAVLSAGLRAVLAILTIYALPIVFLKRTNVPAILAGISYLSQNLAASAWIAGVLACSHLLSVAGMLMLKSSPTPGGFALAMATRVLAVFLFFVSFTAASRTLLEITRQAPGNEA